MAVNHPQLVGSVPQIATIVKIPDDLTETPEVEIAWIVHEREIPKRKHGFEAFKIKTTNYNNYT